MTGYGLDKIPFSRYGSYLVISKDRASDSLYVRDLHGGDEAPSLLYEMCVEGYAYHELLIIRTQTSLILRAKEDRTRYVKIVFGRDDSIYYETVGLTLVFRAAGGKYDTLVPLSDRQFEHHFYGKQRKILFSALKGCTLQEQIWCVTGSKNAIIKLWQEEEESVPALGVMQCYKTVPKELKFTTMQEAQADVKEEYSQWENVFQKENMGYEESQSLAVYLIWCNFVHAEGFLKSDAMYMSKNWMYNIWSWDNCFGGITLSQELPELAYGQFSIFFDHQDESGVYPDFVNETFASFNCTKPPIHAWAYHKMMQQNSFFGEKENLERAYESFRRVAKYWEKYRTPKGAVLPVYYHGNDSGWDNASTFHRGFPVESPDLSAFLIHKMDLLSQFAIQLSRHQEANAWKDKADAMFDEFMERFYDKAEGRFFAIYTPTGEKIREGNSLLVYLPIIILYRMEKEVGERLVQKLLDEFMTPYGLATEQPDSNYYKKGGYWLGPIWAPTTYLFIDALRENGYADAAKKLAFSFFELTNIGLMSENYDPFTGEGYDDPAFAWPSCVFLQLLKEYSRGRGAKEDNE